MQINKEYIELLKSLTAINPSVLIVRDETETNNIVRQINASRDTFYELGAPRTSFDFEGDCIAFFQFGEFHDLFSAFKNTEVSQLDERKLRITDVDSGDGFTYSTHEKKFITGVFKSVTPVNPHFRWVMNDKMRSAIKSRMSLIGATNLRIASLDDGSDAIRITAFNKDTQNDFFFDLRATEDHSWGHVDETRVNVVFPASVIAKLPNGEYKVEVSNDGLITFILSTDGISLRVMASSIDDNTEAE